MFPRRKRLSRAAFPPLLKKGHRLSSTHFSVVISTEERGYAVIVPKKIARLSVTRHRVKRRIFAALRDLPSLPLSLAVFPKASAVPLTYGETATELAALLSKIR